jgi:hypothetical protein
MGILDQSTRFIEASHAHEVVLVKGDGAQAEPESIGNLRLGPPFA